MRSNAIDSKNAGQRNEKFVIELLRRFGALSQSDICKESGLGSSTISYITARLRDKGLICEKAGQSFRPGAKPRLIEINPTGQFVAGIEISPSRVYVGLFDFNTELFDSVRIAIDANRAPENIVSLIEVNVRGLLGKNQIPEDKLDAIGITLSGSISEDGTVQLASPLGWKNVRLKEMLASKFDCRIGIYTTRVRLLAEMQAQPNLSSKNILYLNVDNGVGTNIVADGRLIGGATGKSGELGHVIIDPNGPDCGCGHKGCLEAHISGPAIAKKILDRLATGQETILKDTLRPNDVPEEILDKLSQAVDANDAYAIGLRDYIADKLSDAAAIAINLYDPDTLILAGYVFETFGEYFTGAIKQKFSEAVYDQTSRNIEILTARAGKEALIKGVAAAITAN